MTYVVKHDGVGRDVAATSAAAAYKIAERFEAEGKPHVRVTRLGGGEWTAREFKAVRDGVRFPNA